MRIAIIGAMHVEVDYLRKQLKSHQTTKIGIFTFYEGEINGVNVVILLSGIGKVSAAVATSLLIERYQPDLIINTGTAGGLGTAKVKDLILASKVRHHDVDVTVFGYELGQQAQMPAFYSSDKKWNVIAKENAASFSPQLHFGEVVSGDSFINDPERTKAIEKNFPEAKAVEMEAAAIAQTCYLLNTPFVMLRAISDRAGEGDASSYEQFVKEAGELSAKINLSFIEKIASVKPSQVI